MKYKFRTNEKATVTATLPKEEKKRAKGIIPPITPPEYLKRRAKRGTYVRYFDRGALADGSDVGYCYTPDFDSLMFSGLGTNVPISPWKGFDCSIGILSGVLEVTFGPGQWIARFNNVDYTSDYNTFFLDGDVNAWAATYQEVTDALDGEYGLSHNGLEGYTAGKGFKLSDAELTANRLSINNGRHFIIWDTDGTSATWSTDGITVVLSKITSTPNYADSPVTFNLDRSCDVFLMPSLNCYWGWATGQGVNSNPADYTAGETGTTSENWILNGIFQPYKREMTINNSSYDLYLSEVAGNFKETLSTTSRNWWYSQHVGDANAGLIYWKQDGTSGTADPSTYSAQSPTLFPQDNSLSTLNRNFRPSIAVNHFYLPEGLLIAVIKKGDDIYYIWNTTTRFMGFLGVTFGAFV